MYLVFRLAQPIVAEWNPGGDRIQARTPESLDPGGGEDEDEAWLEC